MKVSGQFHAPAALLPRKDFWYSLARRLVGSQSQSELCDEKKNIPSSPFRELNCGRSGRSLLTILPMHSRRLKYQGTCVFSRGNYLRSERIVTGRKY
jgi:hypothetical protein